MSVHVGDRDKPVTEPTDTQNSEDVQTEEAPPEPLGLEAPTAHIEPARDTSEPVLAALAELRPASAPVLVSVDDDVEQNPSDSWEISSVGSQQAAV